MAHVKESQTFVDRIGPNYWPVTDSGVNKASRPFGFGCEVPVICRRCSHRYVCRVQRQLGKLTALATSSTCHRTLDQERDTVKSASTRKSSMPWRLTIEPL